MRRFVCATLFAAGSAIAHAHDGPPFPILSDHATGPYVISIWTDPDTTDDQSAGGQFWVRLHTPDKRGAIPEGTRVIVGITPAGDASAERTAPAAAVRGDVSNQFAALRMDREGRFAVRVAIDGPLGAASALAAVDASYDLRPAPSLLVLYLLPFLLVGLLWGRLLMRRRRGNAPRGG